MTNRLRSTLIVALACVGGAGIAVRAQAPANAAGVNVTVTYRGKGTVDANHRIWVWLFTTPEISEGSIPIAEVSIEKNGATATFTGVSATPVYIAIAYDEAGGFTGQAPPPAGSPVGFFGAKGPTDKPAPVTPGAKGSVTYTLTDAQRMQ